MNTAYHFLLSALLALLFVPTYKWLAVIVLIGGFIIDADHIFWYWLKYKSLSLARCYAFYNDQVKQRSFNKSKGILLPFHTIEFLILLIIGSFFSEIILLFTAGVVFHYVLDAIWLYSVPKSILANHSIISWISKNKKKKRPRFEKY